jgi:hypothetical protein
MSLQLLQKMDRMSSAWILGVRSNSAALVAFAIGVVLLTALSFEAEAQQVAEEECSVRNAKPVTFRYAEKYASVRTNECIKITGYILGSALHRSKKVALSVAEPGWQTIGVWRVASGEEGDPALTPDRPRKVTVIGKLDDCGSRNWPQYCHYIGGTIISIVDVKFAERG